MLADTDDEVERFEPLKLARPALANYLDLDASDVAEQQGRSLGEVASDGTPEERPEIRGVIYDMSGLRRANEECHRAGQALSQTAALDNLLKAHKKAFDEGPALDEVEQLAVLFKAVELARQAAPDNTLNFDLALGYIAGSVAGANGAGRAKALADTL